jgi:hypothetical protein
LLHELPHRLENSDITRLFTSSLLPPIYSVHHRKKITFAKKRLIINPLLIVPKKKNLIFSSFLLAPLTCTEGIHCDISEQAYIQHWLPPPPWPPKTIAKDFIVYIICVYNAHQPYSPSLISSIQPSTSTPIYTDPILWTFPSILISKSVFTGFLVVSQPWIYRILITLTPFVTLPYSFPPSPCYSTAFRTYHTDAVYFNIVNSLSLQSRKLSSWPAEPWIVTCTYDASINGGIIYNGSPRCAVRGIINVCVITLYHFCTIIKSPNNTFLRMHSHC